MPSSYENPLAGMPDANIPSNPFWSGVNQNRREQMAQPFYDQAVQGGNLDLQKHQVEVGEFMSPQAVQMRESARAAELAKSKAETELIPGRTEVEKAKNNQILQTIPQETQLKLKENAQKISELEGKPVATFMKMGANLYSQIKDLPPAQQAQQYQNLIQQFQATHPGQQLPPAMQQFTAGTLDGLKSAYIMDMYSTDFQQKMAEGKQKGEYGVKEAGIHAGGTVAAASIAAKASTENNQRTLDYGTPARFATMQQRILSDPKASPEQKASAESTLYEIRSREIDDVLAKDPVLQSISTLAGTNPQARELYQSERTKMRIERLLSQGVTPRLQDFRSLYPGKSDSDLQKAAKAKFGKELK